MSSLEIDVLNDNNFLAKLSLDIPTTKLFKEFDKNNFYIYYKSYSMWKQSCESNYTTNDVAYFLDKLLYI
jgi:hypothetical protein